MPKNTVRIERIEVANGKQEEEWLFVTIDTDGDLYLSDGSGDSAIQLMVRKHMVPALVKALRLAISV